MDAGVEALKEHPELVRARTGLGETPLHHLVVENQLDAVNLLIAHGANVNTVSDVKGTPLSEAASLGYEEMVNLLLANGASLSLPNQESPTIIEAVRSGNVNVVDLLIKHGATLDVRDDLRYSVAHAAAEDDERASVLGYLLANGAEPNARGLFEWTPLHVAALHGCHKNVEVLLGSGADRTLRDDENLTALGIARKSGNTRIVELLESE